MEQVTSERECVDYIKAAIMNDPYTYRRVYDYRDYYTTRETLRDKVVVLMSCKSNCGEAFSDVVRFALSWLEFSDREMNLAIYELLNENAWVEK